ncbi:histidine phosphatase family protein [Candidatus Microgenomates bacterium]|nr:histidine phosphatase family protein [Candidatus Microgenomates bacterium]
MALFFLIRHGESIANRNGIYQGQSYDTDLSFLGIKQAEALAKRLKKFQVDKILTSPLKRTLQTAQIIAEECKTSLIIDQGLMETNHGLWEGKSIDEVKTNYPEIFNSWQKTPSKTIFPQGESFLNTARRVKKWLKNNKELEGKIVVVAHDNILRIIFSEVLGFPLDKIWAISLDQAAISIVSFEDEARLLCLNDSNHLNKLKSNIDKQAL